MVTRLFSKSLHLYLRFACRWSDKDFFIHNFFPTTLCRGQGSNPHQSVELHWPGTFEGHPTDWASAPRSGHMTWNNKLKCQNFKHRVNYTEFFNRKKELYLETRTQWTKLGHNIFLVQVTFKQSDFFSCCLVELLDLLVTNAAIQSVSHFVSQNINRRNNK